MDPKFMDPVFKGCTRPALWMGVPYIPLLCVTGFIAWAVSWTTVFILITLPPIVLGMGAVTRSDDQAYRLYWLRFYCRIVRFNWNARFWRGSTYSPLKLEKRR